MHKPSESSTYLLTPTPRPACQERHKWKIIKISNPQTDVKPRVNAYSTGLWLAERNTQTDNKLFQMRSELTKSAAGKGSDMPITHTALALNAVM